MLAVTTRSFAFGKEEPDRSHLDQAVYDTIQAYAS